MTWQGLLSLALTVGALLTLVLTRAQAHLVMMAVLAILSVTGVLTASEALTGFGNPGVITVAAMFVLAAGVHSSGGIDMLVQRFLGHPRSVRRAQARILLPVIFLSGFLNNTPVVATMIPAIHSWARKINVAASKLLIPLSYAAILGGTLTMIGTSTNLVVNGLYQEVSGGLGFSIFAIAFVGLPAAILGGLFILLWFPRALPAHSDQPVFGDTREFTLEVAVAKDGPLVGQTILQAGLRNLQRIFLVEIERGDETLTAVGPNQVLQGGDRLVFAGDTEAISDLLRMNGIVPSSENPHPSLESHRGGRRLVEVVISPHSSCVGETIRGSGFRDRYSAAVLAVGRNGERVRGNMGSIRLRAGDSLLLEASDNFLERQRFSRDFLLVNDLDRSQPRHERAMLAWAVLGVAVLLAATGLTSMFNAALLGAGAMILTRCLSANEAIKSLDLRVLITISASFSLGLALQKTGVAAMIGGHIMTVTQGNPLLLLIAVYLLVSVLTEMVTNNAAALIMVPIALSASATAGLPAEPFLFAIMMAASASFATPLGYQTNLMVFGPGKYRYRDYLKVGVPMNLFIALVSISVISLRYGYI